MSSPHTFLWLQCFAYVILILCLCVEKVTSEYYFYSCCCYGRLWWFWHLYSQHTLDMSCHDLWFIFVFIWWTEISLTCLSKPWWLHLPVSCFCLRTEVWSSTHHYDHFYLFCFPLRGILGEENMPAFPDCELWWCVYSNALTCLRHILAHICVYVWVHGCDCLFPLCFTVLFYREDIYLLSRCV